MRKAKVVTMVGLIFSLLVLGHVFAQADYENVELVGRIGEIGGLDRAWGVAFSPDGNYAYVPGKGASAPTVWILSVSDPTNPSVVKSFGIPNPENSSPEAWGIQVVGNNLYVAAFVCGLWIYDISDPVNPTEVGHHTDGYSECRELYVDGNYCYTADAWNGLSIYDVSNPASPTRLMLYNTDADIDPGNKAEFHDVKVVNDTAYCACGDHGLVIVDVTDKASPAGISFCCDCVTQARYPDGPYDWGRGVEVDVSRKLAFLGDNRVGLRIVDISDPASPTEVGYYDLSAENIGELWKFKIIGNLAYVPYEKKFAILDITDPASPIELSTTPITGKSRALDVVGSYSFMVEEKSFFIMDVSDPAAPVEVGTTAKPGVKRPWMVKVVGNYAYIADLSLPGLMIYDVSNPAAPEYKACAQTGHEAWDVDVVGNYAYVADMKSGLWIFDISDPASPESVAVCITSDNSLYGGKNSESRGVKVLGDYAYVGDAWGGLTIVDISDPTHPVKVANIGDDDMEAHRLDVVGNYCYIGAGRGVAIVDVTNPATPSLVGFLKGQVDLGWSWGRGVRVFGNYAYYSEGLRLISIADPANPVEENAYFAPSGGGWDNKVLPGAPAYGRLLAYYAARNSLRIVDVTDVAADTLVDVGYYSDPEGVPQGRGIDVVDDYVYMAGESPSVVCIFRFIEPTGVEMKDGPVPVSYTLHQNYPNPFNPVTTIEYQLAKTGQVSLKVYDVLGHEVASLIDGRQSAGSYQVSFDASELASGIYFYQLEAGSFIEVCKMVLIR